MAPAAVVVLGIPPERPIQMTPTEDERPVEALRSDRLDQALGVRIGVRGLVRREDHPDYFGTDNLIERSAELGVPVTDEEPEDSWPIVETQREVAGLLGDPYRVGVRRRGAHDDPPAAELDEGQNVKRPEPGGLDGEEVAGDDPTRLRPQELGPGGTGAPWGWTEARRPDQAPDGRRSDANPELAQLASEPDAAPAGVLSCQPKDQLADLPIDRRPARDGCPHPLKPPDVVLLGSTNSTGCGVGSPILCLSSGHGRHLIGDR
ncbi:MAG: hypothetical protein ABI553_04525 [Chloroflexota bacterium]